MIRMQGRYTGVRNLQARGFLRDRIAVGDLCFFYHSSCKVPGIAGIVEVVATAVPDDDALDAKHPLYDEKHTKDKPRWFCCDVKLVRPMKSFLSLHILRAHADRLSDMVLLRQPRLSVQPVKAVEWEAILGIESELESVPKATVPKPIKSTDKHVEKAPKSEVAATATSGKKRRRSSAAKSRDASDSEAE
jgi:predicted RNA-binding protein with PUA-like domain